VAGRTLRCENLRAVLNVGLEIFRSAILPLGMRARSIKKQDSGHNCAQQHLA
jgi:hypothetical protein